MSVESIAGQVFVIDDVECNRRLAKAYLERLGWQVTAFADARSAFESLENTHPQAMLIDVRMPGISGDLLASMLRSEPATAGIRLVAYTAHALPDEVATLKASGFDEVLIKPVLMADMARALPSPSSRR